MKKNIFALTLAGAVALAGCQKETSPVAPEEVNPIVITALADIESNVKTTLDGASVLWNASDKIAVYDGSVVAEFTTNVADGSATADFTTTNPSFSEADSYLAAYPYADGLSFSDGKVSLTVPATQTAKAGSFANGANVAVASGAAESLQFKNVCAYLKFTVPAKMTDLTKVVLSANGSEKLAGNVKTACADASFEVVDGVSSVALEGTFEAGKSYYIAVLPGTLEGGFTITMTRGESTTVTMNTTKKFTFTRSHSANIGELYDGTWKVALEGDAVPAATYMENCGNGYCSFRGNLSAGELKMRVLYENLELGSVNIPSDGWYHILLDTTTGAYQVYTQDVFVDLGNGHETSKPWNNHKIADGVSIDPLDYTGNASGLSIKLSGKFVDENQNNFFPSPVSFMFLDDNIEHKVFCDAIKISGTKGKGNVGPEQIVISGLESSAGYEIRIIAVRPNGSKSARIASFSINDNTSDIKSINTGIKLGSGDEFYLNWASVPFENFVARFNDCKPTAEGTLTINVTAIDTGKASEAHVCAIQILKKIIVE